MELPTPLGLASWEGTYMDKFERARTLKIELESIKTAHEGGIDNMLTIINETLRTANELAEQVLGEQEQKEAA